MMKILHIYETRPNGVLAVFDGYMLLGGTTKVSRFLGWRNKDARLVYTAVPGDRLLVIQMNHPARRALFMGAVRAYSVTRSPIMVFVRWLDDGH